MQNQSDLEIIASVLDGNRDDYRHIIRRYSEKAYCLLRRMLHNQQEAEDALQESFIKAFIALPAFRQEAKFSTWFYRIVYTTALNKAKRRKQELLTEELPDSIAQLATETDCYRKELIEKLIATLEPASAAVLQLYYYDSLSCAEIADITKLSVANIKVLLYRGRITLKQLVEKNHLQGEL